MERVRLYRMDEAAELLAPPEIVDKARWFRSAIRRHGLRVHRQGRYRYLLERDLVAARDALYPPPVCPVVAEPGSPVPVHGSVPDRVVSLADSLAAGSRRRRSG